MIAIILMNIIYYFYLIKYIITKIKIGFLEIGALRPETSSNYIHPSGCKYVFLIILEYLIIKL